MENTKTNKVFGHQSHYRLYVIDPKQAQIGQTVAQFRNIAKQAEREGRVTVPAGKKRKRQKEPS
ncbi:hypothetical protein EM6_0481 [Asticcacaulis excentricus]|uniref:Uncharacterized protein n=2 Tax=Asticcacaulis excentricus TaxID=78587 RepID=A0A3G9G4L6_9CAUL|nr:hypothetical protein EM6_0481 [Asticcacaulis excentricus]